MTKCLNCGADNPPNSAFCENCGKPVAPAGAGGAGLQTLSGLQTIGGDPTLDRRAYPKDEKPTLEPGAVFADRYTIVSVIGTGGMGVVYRARDRIGDREVALKLIRSDRLGGESAVNRLISEGVLTQDIRHKNVVSVYHVDQRDGRPFIAMELVNGVSLREWLRKQRGARVDVPTKVAARIVNEVLHGLQAAHDLGIVHRDLKPENIMLTGEPSGDAAPLKLLDFGIARADGKRSDSNTSSGLGTPDYMAPEQKTSAESAGPSADLYSLSVIFYELLVGVLPQGHWQPPSSGRADVPSGIDALIQSGLQNREASRPQSVADYRQKLNAAFGGTPIRVDDRKDVGPVLDNAGPAKPGKWLAIGGAVVAGLAVVGAIAGLDDSDPPDNVQIYENRQSSTNEADDVVREEEVSPGPNYAQLSGRWLYELGYIDVSASSDGRFSGNGATLDGAPFTVNGSFAGGLSGNYTVASGAGALSGQVSWDGDDCHLAYRTFGPNGQIALQGQFHVDHQPGAPCPARWSARAQ